MCSDVRFSVFRKYFGELLFFRSKSISTTTFSVKGMPKVNAALKPLCKLTSTLAIA